jgi:hypothetical protein
MSKTTCTAIAFLMPRVRAPNKDDWNKLVHLMKYLRSTCMLPLILSANGTGIMKWWVDVAFAVHPNMQGHNGGGLSLGRGFPIVSSTKHKLNTQSSMESEIVGADDFMPVICWTQYFMDAQPSKDTKFRTIFCSRTTRAQFFWKRMERLRAASIRSMSMFGTSLLPIESTRATYHWSGVQPETWSETS